MTFMRKLLDVLNINNWEDGKYIKSIEDTSSSNKETLERYNAIYNGTLPKRNEEIISREILSTVGVCSSETHDFTIETLDYLSTNPSRIDRCIYGAKLCIPPINNNELYLIACAFLYAGASCRNEAIYWTKKYIECGAISDYIPSLRLNTHGFDYDQRIKWIALTHANLANLYADEKKYEESYIEYRNALSIAPYLDFVYVKMAHNFIKQKNYNQCRDVMNEAKNSIYYKISRPFKENIDIHIKEYENEIATIKYYENVIMPKICRIVNDTPGIKQTDLYLIFPNIEKQYIRRMCKYLSNTGLLIRNKRGNTYLLYPTSH